MSGGIDHLVLCVRDLVEGRRFYERLGFNMTPLAYHPFGTANCLAQLQGSFLEVLGVADAKLIFEHDDDRFSFGAYNRDFLEFAPGMSMMVYEIGDARAAQRSCAERGLDTYEPFDFSRQAILPDGSEVTVGFSLAFITHCEMPRSVFFFCEQHAPEHFWKAEYQVHPNTARSVEEVVMVADQPMRYCDFFARLNGTDNVEVEDDDVYVSTPRGRVSMLSRARFEKRFESECPTYIEEGPRFAAYVIGVEDLKKVHAKAVTSGVPHIARAGTITVPGSDAHGVLIQFTAAV